MAEVSDPKLVTDKSPKHLLAIQRYVMNSQRYVGGVDTTIWGGNLVPGGYIISGGTRNGQVLGPSDYTSVTTAEGVTLTLTTALNDGRVLLYPAIAGYTVTKLSGTVWRADRIVGLKNSGGIYDGIVCSLDLRKNYAPELNDMTTWTRRGSCSVSITDSVVGITSYRITNLGASGSSDTYRTSSAPYGKRYPSIWLRPVSISGSIVIQDPYTSISGRWAVDLSKLSSGWQRISETHPSVQVVYPWNASNNNGGFQISNSSSSGLLSFDIAVSGIYDIDGGIPIPNTSPTVDASLGAVSDDGSRMATLANASQGIEWIDAPDNWSITKIDDTHYKLYFIGDLQDPQLIEADLNAVVHADEMLELRGDLTVYNDLTISGKLYITQELGF